MKELQAIDISAGYGDINVLSGIDVTLRTHEIVGIIGPNGCGKSTLLKVLNGSLRPTGGDLWLDGAGLQQMPRRQRARWMATVPQNPEAPDGMTVRQLVTCGRTPYMHWLSPLDDHGRSVVEASIERCELKALVDRPLSQLSGGERQRAWIAMALAQEPHFLLLDEPTSALDVGHQLDIMNLLRFLIGKREMSITIVLHDINLAMRYCQRVILMNQGQVVRQFAPSDVDAHEAIEQVFGVRAVRVRADEQGNMAQLAFDRDFSNFT